jgi:hypothetical protein
MAQAPRVELVVEHLAGRQLVGQPGEHRSRERVHTGDS